MTSVHIPEGSLQKAAPLIMININHTTATLIKACTSSTFESMHLYDNSTSETDYIKDMQIIKKNIYILRIKIFFFSFSELDQIIRMKYT